MKRTKQQRVMKRSKQQRIMEAVDDLQKAIRMPEPHIAIRFDLGMPDKDSPRGKKFLDAIKGVVDAYREFYGMKKEEIDVRFRLMADG